MNLHVSILLLSLIASCSGVSNSSHVPAPTAYTAIADLSNATQMGDLVLAGQPTTAQVAALGAAGVTKIIDICRPEERPDRDEAAEAAAAGIEYLSLPVSSPETMSDEYIDRLRAELRAAEGQPTLLHCRSANRVGAVLIPYLVLDQGRGLDQAIEEAKQVGLRSDALQARAVDYTSARQDS